MVQVEVLILAFFAFLCLVMAVLSGFCYWVRVKQLRESLEMSFDYSDKLLSLLKEVTAKQGETTYVHPHNPN